MLESKFRDVKHPELSTSGSEKSRYGAYASTTTLPRPHAVPCPSPSLGVPLTALDVEAINLGIS
jgi:hypothetical protein